MQPPPQPYPEPIPVYEQPGLEPTHYHVVDTEHFTGHTHQQPWQPEWVGQASNHTPAFPGPQGDFKAERLSGVATPSTISPHDGRSRLRKRCGRRSKGIIAGILFMLLIVGGLVGGILGGLSSKDSTQEVTQGAFLPEPTETHSPRPNNDTDTDKDTQVTLHNATRLATAVGGTSNSGFRLLLFQDDEGELTANEYRGSRASTYAVRDRFSGASLPQPLNGTALDVISFGSDGDLHLFYIDKDFSFSHIVRRSRADGENSWEIGTLSEDQSWQKDTLSEILRVSVTILPAGWTNVTEDSLAILYQSGVYGDNMHFLSTTDPDRPGSWVSMPFEFSGPLDKSGLYPGSSGLVVVPVARRLTVDDSIAGIRMIWDAGEETFGIIDCTFTDRSRIKDCTAVEDSWDNEDEWRSLARRPKPWWLSAFLPTSEDDNNDHDVTEMILRVLDSNGVFSEHLWLNDQWVEYKPFSVDEDDLPTNITSIATANDGLLFAVAEGRLLEFTSAGAWWKGEGQHDDPTWKFVGDVDMALDETI